MFYTKVSRKTNEFQKVMQIILNPNTILEYLVSPGEIHFFGRTFWALRVMRKCIESERQGNGSDNLCSGLMAEKPYCIMEEGGDEPPPPQAMHHYSYSKWSSLRWLVCCYDVSLSSFRRTEIVINFIHFLFRESKKRREKNEIQKRKE